MTVPLDKQEQLVLTYFKPSQIIAVLFAQTDFDAVWVDDPKTGEPKQAYGNIKQAEQDCLDMQEFLLKFGVQPSNIHLQVNPTEIQTKKLYMQLLKQLVAGRKRTPQEDYLMIHTFAGHGVQDAGTQWLLHNEWSRDRKFYKMFAAENKLRMLAQEFQNSYQIGVFACCRQRHDPPVCYPKGQRPAKPEEAVQPQDLKSDLDLAIEGEIEVAKGSGKGTRGNTAAAEVKRENVLLLFGCRPSLGVDAETTMIRDLIRTLLARLDRSSLAVTFPKVLDQMQGSDASFEMAASNSIMPMKLFYDHNIVSHKVGLIFVQTTVETKPVDATSNENKVPQKAKALPWKNAAQNGADAVDLLKSAFGFSDVTVVTDGSKQDIIKAYDAVQAKAEAFDKSKKAKEAMLVCVFWIGHTWYQTGHHKQYQVKPADKAPGKQADGTIAPSTFGVTKDGDFIANYEYISRIVNSGKNTHLLYVMDWFSLHLGQLNADYIKKDIPWWELKLDNHSGWSRMNCVNTGVGEFCLYFNQQRKRDVHVFQFPFHLNAGEFNPTAWRGVKVPEQVVLDLRSDVMKKIISKNEQVRTLKHEYDVWEERPTTEVAEEVGNTGMWNQTVEDLRDQSQILHCCKGRDTSKVDFIFHENEDHGSDGRLDEMQRISVSREHYRFGLVAKNYTGSPIKNKFVAVLFANGCNKTPSKTLVFTRPDESSPWNDPPQGYPNSCEGNFSEVFRHAFLVPTKEHGTCLMIFRDEHALVFNEQMEEVSRVNYQKERNKVLVQNYITAPDYNTFKNNGASWMMTFQVGNNRVTSAMCDNIYEGNTMQNTWCMRWSLKPDATVHPVDSKKQSIFFKVEAIQGFCEYAPNRMCFYGRQEHLFIVHDWKVVRRINDANLQNINKYSINTFPGFDEEEFPFLATSGESTYNLVNVKTGHMEVLIRAATSALHAQPSCFFTRDSANTITMHFPTTRTTEENMTRQNWHIMKFKSDFVDTLTTYGRLPLRTPEEGLKLYKENERLKAMLAKAGTK